MEAYEKNYCYDNKEPKKRGCLDIVTTILAIAFSVVIGIIIGAVASATILGAIAAVIVLAVILGLLVILSLILMFCNRKKEKKEKYKCCD